MKDIQYVFNDIRGITVKGKTQSLFLEITIIKNALNHANRKIEVLKKTSPEVFEVLGLRNLSSFIGETFVRSLATSAGEKLVKNPHQDGYPDLFIMTDEGKALWEKLKPNRQDKSPFSGFETGGIEVKATCGGLPTPDYFRKKSLRKPDLGDERINHVRGYDWKAHHRETNNMIGIFWDFIDQKPIICGLFFCGNLIETDWGAIVHPKEGGGRTTSVSIMTRDGIKKLYNNWIAVIDDSRYAKFFDEFNQSDLIGKRLAK